jgi:rRNA-processing protein FCF1
MEVHLIQRFSAALFRELHNQQFISHNGMVRQCVINELDRIYSEERGVTFQKK